MFEKVIDIIKHWNDYSKSKKYYLSYTAAFVAISLIVFSIFILRGKSLVWASDGLWQHFNAFAYMGEWLRNLISSFLAGSPEFPMFDFSIGYGADIITTLSYYVFGDPFVLISLFFPQNISEIGYCIAILLRFYSAGIAFSIYARKMGCSNFTTFCGVFVYVFCLYSLYAGIRHPYFMDPMIWLPLIFFGLEKILSNETPIPYIMFVFLMTISNFYFLYMVLILTLIYGVCRLLLSPNSRTPRQTFALILKAVVFTCLGVGLGSVIFIPTAMAFFDNTRVSNAYKFDYVYPLKYYQTFFAGMVSPEDPGSWSEIGMAPICWLGVISFFLNKHEDRSFKVYFLILLIMLLFPIVGHIMNGFGYVSNRWVFAWSFWCAFLFAKGLPDLISSSKRDCLILTICCLVFSIIAVLGVDKSSWKPLLATIVGCFVLICSIIPVLISLRMRKTCDEKPERFRRVTRISFFLATVICVTWTAFSLYIDYSLQFVDRGKALETLEGNRVSLVSNIDTDEFYRVESEPKLSYFLNYPLTQGISSTTFYWSLNNPNVVEFLDQNSAFSGQNYNLRNLMSRTLLLPLVSGRYFAATSGEGATIPYSFNETYRNETSALYESQKSLPFGYTYSSYIPSETFNDLSIVQRQQAMLQGAYLNDSSDDLGLNESNLVFVDRALNYDVISSNNAEYKSNLIKTKKKDSKLELAFDCPSGCELYVVFEGLEFEGVSTKAIITADCNGAQSEITHYTSGHIYAMGRENYLLNLGYSDKERSTITLVFGSKGTYSFKNLSVVCQPMNGFENYIDALQEDVLENVEFGTNKISGSISLDESKLLCLSLPYSKGWKATVDGQPVDTVRVNSMFTGLMLSEGEHEVMLTYETPFLRVGVIVSVACLVVVILIGVGYRRKRKQRMERLVSKRGI